MTQILLRIRALYIKHINQHLHTPKNQIALAIKIRLVKRVLPAAIPQVQDQIPQEADVVVLHVQGGRQPHRVPRHVVGKNKGAHGRLARPGLAHEQDLFLGHFGGLTG